MMLVALAACAPDDSLDGSSLADSLFGPQAQSERQAAELGRFEILQECMSEKGFEFVEPLQLSTDTATSFRIPVDPVQAAQSGYGIADQLKFELAELSGESSVDPPASDFEPSQAETDAYIRAIDGDEDELGCRDEAEMAHPIFPVRTPSEEQLIRNAADSVAHSDEYEAALRESESCMAQLGQLGEAGTSAVHQIHELSDAVLDRALSQLEATETVVLSDFDAEIADIRNAEIAHATASAECESAAIELYNSLFEEFVRDN